jgi:7-dehydrocholesterol reductase
MPEILGCFNTVAMVLCVWLLLDGRRKKKSRNPLLYDFYRGCELHPRLFGCDVKQLTNCRIGLILWQVRKAITSTSPNCYFKNKSM